LPSAYVDAFESICERLGIERWFLIGHSLGAALSVRYALDHPGRVIAHVFMNSNSALADEQWSNRVRAGVERAADAIETGGREAVRSHPLNPARAKRLPQAVREGLTADAELHTPQGIASTFRYTVPDSPVRSRIGENRVPALLVVGTREKAFAPSREYAERHMPMLEVVEADAGHAVSIDDAGTFNASVTAFLRKHA
jgi:pimeloyl-ACP methyl ester carboxylesterase